MGKRLECRGCYLLVLSISIVLNFMLVLQTIQIHQDKTKAIYVARSEVPVSGVTYAIYDMLTQMVEVKPNYSVEVVQASTYSIEEGYEPYASMDTPSKDSNKTYMDAKYITDTTSDAYKLKQYYEVSDTGIYTVDGRYCAAIGSYYTTQIGTKFDVVLTTGKVIECILADCKSDKDTDITNRQNSNGSVVEFVVNTDLLPELARLMGDLSYIGDDFYGEIDYIKIYGGV